MMLIRYFLVNLFLISLSLKNLPAGIISLYILLTLSHWQDKVIRRAL